MKKSIAILLSAMLIFSLCACGEAEKPDTGSVVAPEVSKWEAVDSNIEDYVPEEFLSTGAVERKGSLIFRTDGSFDYGITTSCKPGGELLYNRYDTAKGTYEAAGDNITFTMTYSYSGVRDGKTEESSEVRTIKSTIKNGRFNFDYDDLKLVFEMEE